jgi:protein-L-isoaspartate(D-aspartate) O-methyltransferase
MIDLARLRRNMVECQVQTNDVTDRRILAGMLEIARERFVAPGLDGLAYIDEAVPMTGRPGDRGSRLLPAPVVTAKLINLARIDNNDLVLEIGCGTGYATALLARLCLSVTALESDPALAALARKALSDLSIDNAAIVEGPLAAGHAADGPYDVIVIGGSVPEVPEGLAGQLKKGGRLVAIVGEGSFGRAMLFERSAGGWSARPAFSLAAPPIPGFEKAAEFVF